MAARSIPERVLWAVRTLAVKPSDRLLEIGCGRGVAVSLICEKLADGTITAIDRSATMVNFAERRNVEYVRSGKAVFRTTALGSAELEGERFDKIFAINVNLFWVRPAAKELDLLKGLLKAQGTLYLFYEPPVEARAREVADKVSGLLEAHGFATSAVTATTQDSKSLLCVMARLQ